MEGGDGRPTASDIRTARMLDILRAASRGGRVPRRDTYGLPDAPRTGPALGGCLMRFVGLMIFLLIMFALLVSLVGGSLFQMLGMYYF
jgi:hypothetical protein